MTQRIRSEAGDAWYVHTLAANRRAAGEDIIMLSIGEESAEHTPSHIVEAAIASLRAGRHHYSDVRGDQGLREAIAAEHQRLSGQAVSADHCTAYTGAQNALYAVAQCVLQSGDEVILPEPYYTTYPGVFTAGGATAVKVVGEQQNHYLPTIEQLTNAFSAKTRAVVITQPGNPMGTSYSAVELQALVDKCNERDVWLISDEVYTALQEDNERNCAASARGAERCCISIGSLSKSHRMTGWRIGWAVGPARLAEHLEDLSTCLHYGLPAFVMDAAREALINGGATARLIRSAMQQRRAVCAEQLNDLPDIKLLDSGAGMFVVLDVSQSTLSAHDFALQLLERESVATLPCIGFGPAGQQLVRIGLCADPEQLHDACQRIIRFVSTLNG